VTPKTAVPVDIIGLDATLHLDLFYIAHEFCGFVFVFLKTTGFFFENRN
jgi:hypothetical protein